MSLLDLRTRLDRRRAFAVAGAVGAAQVVGTYFASRNDDSATRSFDLYAALLLLVGPAALVFRRRYPRTVLVVALASTLAYALSPYGHGPIFFALIAAYINCVMSGQRHFAWASLPVGFVAFEWLPVVVHRTAAPGIGEMLGLAAWLFVMAVGTEAFVNRRRQLEEQARTRAAEAKQQASEERLRIAREVHDVVAHNISLINVQAGVALHLLDEQPERAGPALAAIKEASRETLDELKSVVQALRGVDEDAPLAPTPGLDDIERLVARTSDAGLPVRLEVTGALNAPVPAGVDLAAYRIVQEALTNATRHAAATAVTVRVVHGADDLTVEVDDDGVGGVAHNGGTGTGIAGMRERAVALGGTFSAGPRNGRGFRVEARLPLNEDQ